MTLRNLFLTNAIIALLYGIVMLVIPAQFLGFYDVSVNAGGAVIGQLFGTALVAVGLICWLARDAEESVARDAIVVALLWSDVIGAVVCILAAVSGAVNGLGWTSVALYVMLATGYAYFKYVPQTAPAAT